jgi:mono/diheme cytochrome c family protein
MRQCSQCHPGGEAVLGPAINNKPLPAFLIRFQVRHGLGAMPAFSEERVTDSDLTDVIAYLKALRQHG